MSEFPTNPKEIHSERGVTFMTAVLEASYLLKRIAEPRPVGDSVKQAIRRAAQRCGLSFTRAEDLWRQEARLVRAEEIDAIRRAAKHNQPEAKARDELAELRARIARLEGYLLSTDPDMAGPVVAGLREQARQASGSFGAVDRALDRPTEI